MSGKTGFLIFIFVGSIFSFSLLRAGTEKGDLKEYARIVKSAQEALNPPRRLSKSSSAAQWIRKTWRSRLKTWAVRPWKTRASQ